MSFDSPHQTHGQFQFSLSTPPPPPPKPSTHPSDRPTPSTGPPRPPLPGHDQPDAETQYSGVASLGQSSTGRDALVQPPQDGWLPEIFKDKTTADLHTVLLDQSFQQSVIHSPETAHPSLPASTTALQSLLSDNISIATSLKVLESQVISQRQATQSRLLSLRALERQWQVKQAEQEAALQDFSPHALYQRLSAAVGEQESLCKGLEESFLEGGDSAQGGLASEREVAEFVRRLRDARKVTFLRRERKERWDEGRVGGWR